MKFLPLNRNTVPIMITSFVTFGFFFGGLFDVLDLIIVKILLISGFGIVFILTVINIVKNSREKKRPEEFPQDDFINIK